MKIPPEPRWVEIAGRNANLYRALPDELRKEVWGHVRIFLAEKNFEGAGGVQMNEEIMVTIAVQACILMLRRKATYFSRMDSIVVYPHSFFTEQPSHIGYDIMEADERIGESWNTGTVVLAWDHAAKRFLDRASGQNVVIHEFAHQLDQEDGVSDGVPVLPRFSDYKEWGVVLGKNFDELNRKLDHNLHDILDPYAATNHAEFFAVASETFYEKPVELKRQHPDLYAQLKKYYKVDPSEW